MIGLGYYGTLTPAVVRRNVLENPAWYTAYTPYQPEISQGRLEALLNFQTVVVDLTGLTTAGASLLDESTAAAEAMTLMRRASKVGQDAVLLVDEHALPQTVAVIQTRARPLGLDTVVADLSAVTDAESLAAASGGRPVFGVLVQYPGADGELRDLGRPRRRGARVRRAGHRRRRPAGADARDPARGVGRRHRGRHQPALRRADGLRWPARRLHERPRRPGADDAGPAGRRERRRGRRTGLPPGPADPRAAHPPREGHLQHLHRAGPARGHGLHVRRLPRPGRPGARSPAGCTATRRALADALRAGGVEVVTSTSSTPSPCGCPVARPRWSCGGRGARHQPVPGRRRPRVGVSARRDDGHGAPRRGAGRVRRSASRWLRRSRRGRADVAGGARRASRTT